MLNKLFGGIFMAEAQQEKRATRRFALRVCPSL